MRTFFKGERLKVNGERDGSAGVRSSTILLVLSASLSSIASCFIASGGRETAIFTSTGLRIMAFAILRISFGIVAENMIFWQFLGSLRKMVMISS